jgi:hypothetical protein
MRRLGLIVAISAASTAAAFAQPRLSTVALSCGQAAALVASRGAIVLGTGGYTYDRLVSDGRFCLRNETTEPVWAPAADTPQCFVGYRCKDRSLLQR